VHAFFSQAQWRIPDGLCSGKASSESQTCSKSLQASFTFLQLVPYILLEPFLKAGIGSLLYGSASCEIKPQLVFSASLKVAPEDPPQDPPEDPPQDPPQDPPEDPPQDGEGSRRLLEEDYQKNNLLSNVKFGIDLKIPISFSAVAGYKVDTLVKTFEDEYPFGPYQLYDFNFNLLSSHGRESFTEVRSIISDDSSTLGRHDIRLRSLNATSSSELVPCRCSSKNVTIPWQKVSSIGELTTFTTAWQVLNGSLIDTCDFTQDNVDSISMIFTAPATGYYDVEGTLSSFDPDSESTSWGVYARVGLACCGSFMFCDSLSADVPSFQRSIFLHENATLSLVWASSSKNSDAVISTTISLNEDPVVYVDIEHGDDSNDGSFLHPVKELDQGFAILASQITQKVLSATVVVYPTWYSDKRFSISSKSGFEIPSILKKVNLLITSVILRKSSEIFEAWKQQHYCNYLISECVSSNSFYDSVWGTGFDTGDIDVVNWMYLLF
jgi:hypothetical protein